MVTDDYQGTDDTAAAVAGTGKGASAEEQMIQRARATALQNAVVTLLNMTIADKDGVIYAFGSAYADSGRWMGSTIFI